MRNSHTMQSLCCMYVRVCVCVYLCVCACVIFTTDRVKRHAFNIKLDEKFKWSFVTYQSSITCPLMNTKVLEILHWCKDSMNFNGIGIPTRFGYENLWRSVHISLFCCALSRFRTGPFLTIIQCYSTGTQQNEPSHNHVHILRDAQYVY